MRISGLSRYAFVFLAFMQAGLTSGIIYGFPSLEEIFVRERVYRQHCHPDEPEDKACTAQTSFFQLIYTVGVFVNNAAPLVTGVALDKFGPRWTNIGSSFLFCVGCALFALPYDYAKIPAFSLLGLAGPGVYCSIMHLCNLFPGHQASVLSFFSGTFSASSFIFKLFLIIYKPEKWRDMQSIFLEYIVVLAPWFIVGAFVWPNKAFQPPGKKSIIDAEAEETPLISTAEINKREKQKSLYNLPAKEQFMSPRYWLMVIWLALEALSITCYLGTVSSRFPNGNFAGNFNTIWSFGWVAIPVFGAMMDYFGIMFSFNVTSIGLVLFSICKLIPIQNVQYASFALVSTVNVGMWAIFYSYISQKFGFDNYGKLLGVSSLTVAVVGALQYAIDSATIHRFHGNYYYADILFMATSVICLFLSFYMWFVERPPKQKKIIEYYPSRDLNGNNNKNNKNNIN